jgi:hypothetical protein
MVVAVQLAHCAAQSTAHRHPVQEFDALRARKLDQLRDGLQNSI